MIKVQDKESRETPESADAAVKREYVEVELSLVKVEVCGRGEYTCGNVGVFKKSSNHQDPITENQLGTVIHGCDA
jgi:hypothetical protein